MKTKHRGWPWTTENLKQIVTDAYNQLRSENKNSNISPEEVAERAYQNSDPKRLAPAIVQFTAQVKFEEVYRNLHRQGRTTKPPATDEDQFPLFENLEFKKLQKTYAVMRDGHYERVPRKQLTFEEREQISAILHQVSKAYKDHAREFDKETAELLKSGKLQRTA